jgi:inward rectifier potassium channel
MSKEDIRNTDIEIMVFVKAFDNVFSNTVVSRTSYISSEIVWGAKFRMMYKPTPDKKKTVLHIHQLNEFDTVEIPDILPAIANG